jgi:hypothetical protein
VHANVRWCHDNHTELAFAEGERRITGKWQPSSLIDGRAAQSSLIGLSVLRCGRLAILAAMRRATFLARIR